MIPAPSTTTGTSTYALDPMHSSIEFIVRHLMISKVRGRFSAFEGTVDLPGTGDVPSAVRLSIDVASLDTREAQRDAHLKSADFFEAEKFGKLDFTSTRIEGPGKAFKVYGNLTIHGITREVVLDGSFEGRATDPWGGSRIGYSVKGSLDRKDFGLTWNQALETGGFVVSDEVRLEAEVEAILQK